MKNRRSHYLSVQETRAFLHRKKKEMTKMRRTMCRFRTMIAIRSPWRWLIAELGLFGVIYIAWTGYAVSQPLKITFQDFYLYLMNNSIAIERRM